MSDQEKPREPEAKADLLKPADHLWVPSSPEDITRILAERKKNYGPFVPDEIEQLR